MSDVKIFSCPSCGAPQDLPLTGTNTFRCPFCHNTVVINDNIHRGFGTITPENIAARKAELEEFSRLLRNDKKIEAMNQCRKIFGINLEEAFDIVEKLASGESVNINGIQINQYGNIVEEDSSPTRPTTPTWNDEDIQELSSLVQQGRKIEAIKLLRGMFNIGLADAKKAIDEYSTSGSLSILNLTIDATGHYSESTVELPTLFMSLHGSLADRAELSRLISKDDKIGAIRQYREMYDVSLKQAKDDVEKLILGESVTIKDSLLSLPRFPQSSMSTTNLSQPQNIVGDNTNKVLGLILKSIILLAIIVFIFYIIINFLLGI